MAADPDNNSNINNILSYYFLNWSWEKSQKIKGGMPVESKVMLAYLDHFRRALELKIDQLI